MKLTIEDAVLLDVDSIKVFVSRAREKEGFEGLKQSIAEDGLKMPIGVRDISERPPAERKRPGGGLFKYELIFGEGRLTAHKELSKRKILAFIKDAPEAEIVGMFLAENMIRKPLPWAQKAKIVRAEVDAGNSIEEVARKFSITVGHATKLVRISSKTASGLADDIASMSMNAAELITALPDSEQTIVVQVLRENPERQVRDVLKKAKEITEEGKELSKADLQKSLKRIDEDLKRCRDSMKLTRLHHSLGPQNVATLLEDKKFRAALVAAGVNVAKFESLS